MRGGFLLKCAVCLAMVVGFDRLFADYGLSGARIGVFAALCVSGLLLARRDVRASRAAGISLAVAALFAVALFDDPGLLAWVLFWSALSVAALMPKVARFDDAWHWTARLVLHGVAGVDRPFSDIARWRRARRRHGANPRGLIGVLALPLIGAALFLGLFAAANPLIAQGLSAIRLPTLWQLLSWLIMVVCIWPALRPHPVVLRSAARLPDPEPVLPGTSLPSVLIALALFNAIFAVQNGLDIAFLWRGGVLPDGMSQTEYVHRGAYPLIGTALIAGMMALAMLRPGSAAAASPWARRLVTFWVMQNLVLVASSVTRTLDYIDESMLTAWRIAALAWMGLVALGLVLICRRILGGHDARWLVNRNALAAVLLLGVCAFVDLGAVAATWNVRHRAPEAVDLCYLTQVGDGALLPVIALERQPMDPATRDRVRRVRAALFDDLATRQARWQDWTPRGARRLARARALLGAAPPRPRPVVYPLFQRCDGSIENLNDTTQP